MPSKTPSPYNSPWSNTETTALARSYHVPSIQTTEGIAGNLPWMPSHDNRALGDLYRLGDLIPSNASLPEVGLVRHMTRERGIVAEHDVLRHRLPGTHGVKVRGEMRGLLVEVAPAGSCRYNSSASCPRRSVGKNESPSPSPPSSPWSRGSGRTRAPRFRD